MQKFNKMRILIIKPSSLGDIVHTLPLVHALKRSYPDCSIGWIVQTAFAPLLEADPCIDTLYPIHIPSTSDPAAGRFAWLAAFKATLSTLRSLRRQLSHNPYHLILDLHSSFRSGLLGRTNPGGTRFGFKDARELNTLFQNQLVVVPSTVQHALEKNLLFADPLGCEVKKEDFFISTSRQDREEVQSFFCQQGIDVQTPLIYANPAARWKSKFWQKEKWAELADCFAGKSMVMVFGGSGHDLPYIQSIAQLMKTRPLIAAGRFTLPQTVALIQRAALYVGLDSGPMHISALLGTPVAALFGATHPDRVGPYEVQHRIIRDETLDCLECRKRACAEMSCMGNISAARVYEEALSLLHEE